MDWAGSHPPAPSTRYPRGDTMDDQEIPPEGEWAFQPDDGESFDGTLPEGMPLRALALLIQGIGLVSQQAMMHGSRDDVQLAAETQAKVIQANPDAIKRLYERDGHFITVSGDKSLAEYFDDLGIDMSDVEPPTPQRDDRDISDVTGTYDDDDFTDIDVE